MVASRQKAIPCGERNSFHVLNTMAFFEYRPMEKRRNLQRSHLAENQDRFFVGKGTTPEKQRLEEKDPYGLDILFGVVDPLFTQLNRLALVGTYLTGYKRGLPQYDAKGMCTGPCVTLVLNESCFTRRPTSTTMP